MFDTSIHSKKEKNLAFSNSKSYIINFNIIVYNTLNIDGSIFFTTSFKYFFFIIFIFFSLSSSPCLLTNNKPVDTVFCTPYDSSPCSPMMLKF